MLKLGVLVSQDSLLIMCFYACHDELMMDFDLCNDCRQNVGTRCSLVQLLMLMKLVI
jgi:hypothetical protein